MRSKQAKTADDTQPPPYSLAETSLSKQPLNIKASETPQWLWSNAQCRAWIAAVCIEYLQYSERDAYAAAEGVKGFGPRLFGMRLQEWTQILGNADGYSVYTLVFSIARKKGAVPASTTFAHLQNTAEKS